MNYRTNPGNVKSKATTDQTNEDRPWRRWCSISTNMHINPRLR